MRVGVVYSAGDLSEAFPEDSVGRSITQNLQDVKSALVELGHDVITLPADETLLDALRLHKDEMDIIFNLADEGYQLDTSLEPHIVALFELLGLSYTGAPPLILGLCLQKHLAKSIFMSQNLPTPKHLVFSEPLAPEENNAQELSFPLIVKPVCEDGSIGIKHDSVVDTPAALVEKVNSVLKTYQQAALVEEYIEGREVNVGIVGTNTLTVLPPSEILFSLPTGERNFLFYETKWVADSPYYHGTVPHCPAKLDEPLQKELMALAKKAYKAMGLRGYGRVDFRIDQKGQPFILEVNPNPDICKDAGLTRMAAAHGWSYPELIQKILDVSLEK